MSLGLGFSFSKLSPTLWSCGTTFGCVCAVQFPCILVHWEDLSETPNSWLNPRPIKWEFWCRSWHLNLLKLPRGFCNLVKFDHLCISYLILLTAARYSWRDSCCQAVCACGLISFTSVWTSQKQSLGVWNEKEKNDANIEVSLLDFQQTFDTYGFYKGCKFLHVSLSARCTLIIGAEFCMLAQWRLKKKNTIFTMSFWL